MLLSNKKALLLLFVLSSKLLFCCVGADETAEFLDSPNLTTTFHTAVYCVVSSNFQTASASEQQEFVDLFGNTYNDIAYWNPFVCDPFERSITNATIARIGNEVFGQGSDNIQGTADAALVDNGGFRSLQDLESRRFPPNPEEQPDLLADLMPFNMIDLVVEITGACKDCPVDSPLFADDVVNGQRRLKEFTNQLQRLGWTVHSIQKMNSQATFSSDKHQDTRLLNTDMSSLQAQQKPKQNDCYAGAPPARFVEKIFQDRLEEKLPQFEIDDLGNFEEDIREAPLPTVLPTEPPTLVSTDDPTYEPTEEPTEKPECYDDNECPECEFCDEREWKCKPERDCCVFNHDCNSDEFCSQNPDCRYHKCTKECASDEHCAELEASSHLSCEYECSCRTGYCKKKDSKCCEDDSDCGKKFCSFESRCGYHVCLTECESDRDCDNDHDEICDCDAGGVCKMDEDNAGKGGGNEEDLPDSDDTAKTGGSGGNNDSDDQPKKRNLESHFRR